MEITAQGDISERNDPERDLTRDARRAGLEALIIPSFFLGVISQRPDSHPVGDLLPEGQFLYQHQYDGHSCSQAFLRGIFMPVSLISDERIRAGLTVMADRYGLNSLCSSEGFTALQQDLRKLGAPMARPLDYIAGTAEGLIRFDAQPLLDWLHPIASYVQEFSGLDPSEVPAPMISDQTVREACAVSGYPPKRVRAAIEFNAIADTCAASRKISRSASLAWYGLEEFQPWLSASRKLPLRSEHWTGRDFEVRENDIVGAFVYPNGD